METTTNYYFFIQLLPEGEFYDFNEFRLEEPSNSAPELVYKTEQNVTVKINKTSFKNQLMCASVFLEFENFIPTYVVTKDGTLYRFFGQKNSDE